MDTAQKLCYQRCLWCLEITRDLARAVGELSGEGDLIRQAASGSAAAQLSMVDCAMSAVGCGPKSQLEALAAAETWARLAAANGGIDEQRALVRVLLSRAEFEVHRAAPDGAAWYEGEARRILKLLVALDDQEAAQALVELGPVKGEQPECPSAQTLATLAAAACGDLTAIDTLCEEAYTFFQTGQANATEALTIAELYARMGAASGHGGLMRRLAGVLLKRAELEYQDAAWAEGDALVTEAAVLMSIMVDCGDLSVAPWLELLVVDAPRTALASSVVSRPTILKFIEPEGSC